MDAATIVVYSIRGLIVLAALILGAREAALLFMRPGKNMGMGLVRVWAVARTTMLEAWAGRIWLLPVLWLGAALLLILAVRPFDESERIPLYIKSLLSSQEVLLLVMMWVMACVTLPRERERKTLITHASKPLSRLEIILGKVTGLGAVAGLSLVVMGALSMVILHVSDLRMRTRAQESYDLQVRDFNQTLKTPSEGLKQLAEDGSLYAYNNITVPPEGMNLGFIAISKDANTPPVRGIIGGTYEKVIYHFGPRLEEPEVVQKLPLAQMPTGVRPYFAFYFPVIVPPGGTAPKEVKIQVTASAEGPMATQEKVLTLDSQGVAAWEPDKPEDLFSTFDPATSLVVQDRGQVTLEVRCLTPGVILQVLDGADPDATGKIPANTEANVEFTDRFSVYFPGATDGTFLPSAKPIVRGFERRDRQEIEGPKPPRPHELAIYRFAGASLRNVPVENGNFKLTVQLETYKADNPEAPTFAYLQVHSLDPSVTKPFDMRFQVDEKRLKTLEVPAVNLGDKDPSRRGDMIVYLYCDSPGHSISLIENSVRIELGQTPFFVNFFKSEVILFLEALLLIALSVTCSIRLGWPIAMFLSGIAFLFGNLVEWIAGIKEYGGLGALNYHAMGNSTALFNFFDHAASMLWTVLGFISILMPNFNIYQPQEFIGGLQNMPWAVVASAAVNTVIYLIPLLALAHLMFRKQELG